MQVKPIETAIIQLIARELMVDVETVKPESKLMEDLGADSLDRLELCMTLEDEFAIEIPDTDAEKLLTVQQVLDDVGARIAAKAS